MKENKVEKQETQKIREVKTTKKKFNKRFILLYVAIFAFALYSAITIISQNVAINEKKAELAAIEEELQIVEIKNEDLEKINNYTGDELDEYIEDIAREELDYVKNGERVFINVSGN